MVKKSCFLWGVALLVALCFQVLGVQVFAQKGGTGRTAQQADPSAVMQFDKTVHNFGRLMEDDPPVSCTFTFTNKGTKPVAIYQVLSSCGCTTAGWTKRPVAPGESGEVTATFLNDQGPYPFDKSLTVYTSLGRKPIILRIKGEVYPKNKSLRELYPEAFGPLGIQSKYGIDAGQIDSGNRREASVAVANTSGREVRVTFSAKSAGLSLSLSPNPIPAKSVAILSYSIDTKGNNSWGNVKYKAKVACNGVLCQKPLVFNALLLDNFSNLSQEQMNRAPLILEERTSVYAGDVQQGKLFTATFPMQNIGKDPLLIRAVECGEKSVAIEYPKEIKGGKGGVITVKVQSAALAKGENVITLTVVTNSPNRALMNLFVHLTVI